MSASAIKNIGADILNDLNDRKHFRAVIDDIAHDDGDLYTEYCCVVGLAAYRAVLEHLRDPSPQVKALVAANWGRRTWAEYQALIDGIEKEVFEAKKNHTPETAEAKSHGESS